MTAAQARQRTADWWGGLPAQLRGAVIAGGILGGAYAAYAQAQPATVPGMDAAAARVADARRDSILASLVPRVDSMEARVRRAEVRTDSVMLFIRYMACRFEAEDIGESPRGCRRRVFEDPVTHLRSAP
jgi:hypothetical protein